MEMIKLGPVFKDYLWGGVRLREQWNKSCDYDKVAESWELAVHKDGTNTVASGPDAGMKLDEYLKKQGEAYIGKRASAFPFFPVLIKLIDAKDPLSIQVHPSDEYALEHENEFGKTEVWYIVDAEPGSFLYFGLNRTVTPEEFRRRIADNTILEILNKVEVKPGEVYFIPSGTIHAIGAGILICEIQQNSNLTYRVYDYDRRDKDGNPRQLHVEKALKVVNMEKLELPDQNRASRASQGAVITPIADCQYFTTAQYTSAGTCHLDAQEESFTHVMFLAGKGTIAFGEQTLDYQKGDSFLVPAGHGPITIEGACQFIATTV